MLSSIIILIIKKKKIPAPSSSRHRKDCLTADNEQQLTVDEGAHKKAIKACRRIEEGPLEQ